METVLTSYCFPHKNVVGLLLNHILHNPFKLCASRIYEIISKHYQTMMSQI